MSQGFQALLIYIVLTAIFYFWYFAIRYRLNKGLIWIFLLLLNLFFGILLVLPIAQFVFQTFGVTSQPMNFCLSLMALAIVFHHSALFLLASWKNKSKFLEFVHIPLSHILLGIPYFLTALIGANIFHSSVESTIDRIIYIAWIIETAAIGASMVLIGLGLLKANRKW